MLSRSALAVKVRISLKIGDKCAEILENFLNNELTDINKPDL